MRVVLDTNVLIDFLQGREEARAELARYPEPGISIVTWMEILVEARGEDEEARLRRFLAGFRLHAIDAEVAEEAVSLRRTHRMRLPDALIWGTARRLGQLLVTRNTRDFPRLDPGIRVPY